MEIATGFTIDGASSTDLDDAIWVETEGHNMRLQVHVADVASQVQQDSFLDRQTLKRGETAYLPTTRKPLFPHSLEASMSLLPFVERPVITVDILVDPQGELLDVQLSESVLVSQEQFSYEAVEGILRGAPHHLQTQLKLLERVTGLLALQRQQQGAVFGRTVGTNYIDEDGHVVAQSLRSQQIIAELMILTNRVVSEFMRDHRQAWLYRTHDYRDLSELPAARQQFVQTLKAIADEETLRQVLAGHYDRARYSPEAKPHVGLGLAVYAHTTSPIRRYADLVNQRLLKAALHDQPDPYPTATLVNIATQLTTLQHARRDQKNAQHRAQRHSAVAQQVQQTDLAALSPELFSQALKQGVLKNQWALLEPTLRQRLAESTLTPMDFYHVLLVIPNTAATVHLKLQVLAAIVANPMSLQVLNLIRTHWQPTPTVEFKEQSTPAGWAALCVVNQEGKEQCPPAWSIAPRKALAQQDSAYRWLEAWVWKKLVSSAAAQLPATTAPLPVEPLHPAPETLLAANQALDYVSSLNQYAQRLGVPLPEYKIAPVVPTNGLFQCVCECLDLVGTGEGSSKKQAKSKAAQSLWSQIESGAASPHAIRAYNSHAPYA
ncbi:RNB domain-containing ribonuclease [Leptolyngbya sp. FACHB-321]|uniref:RNB domain-containing ribonuclease n=1 Tax=Leptolyngbya sp. FACHB-321 TaxID=2692807 RepID=UPI00168556E2|nr:RNB domain-containing ribonuclease [Leptolyngbya sp. FACHB-321]MBD2038297.1 RNB domain-containing ribonuclease [Leptolyngbya sp. FACHB-321]